MDIVEFPGPPLVSVNAHTTICMVMTIYNIEFSGAK